MPSTIPKKTGYGSRRRTTEVIPALVLGGNSIPTDVVFAYAAGAANVAEVEISVVNVGGQVIAGVHVLDILLSDAATGMGITATAASGTVQAKAASGTDYGALTAKKALRVSTLATGKYTLEITDSAKTGFYVAVSIAAAPVQVSRQLVAGDYGA